MAGMEREIEEWAWRWIKQVAGAMTLRYPNQSWREEEEAARLGIRSLANRKQCLWDLKEIGYQVGCGFMVGSPEQTVETLYEDLQFINCLLYTSVI